jgi:hypothetical protein
MSQPFYDERPSLDSRTGLWKSDHSPKLTTPTVRKPIRHITTFILLNFEGIGLHMGGTLKALRS